MWAELGSSRRPPTCSGLSGPRPGLKSCGDTKVNHTRILPRGKVGSSEDGLEAPSRHLSEMFAHEREEMPAMCQHQLARTPRRAEGFQSRDQDVRTQPRPRSAPGARVEYQAEGYLPTARNCPRALTINPTCSGFRSPDCFLPSQAFLVSSRTFKPPSLGLA